VGYLIRDELVDGTCADYRREFDPNCILEGSASISELILVLAYYHQVFIRSFDSTTAIATRDDLQDSPVRMWLFGLVRVIELHFSELVASYFDDEGWRQYLSAERVDKARHLLEERRRRGQNPSLLDCLQFSDTGQIVVRNEILRSQAEFTSRCRGDEAIKSLERLRNNLAHAQDIVSFDWETSVRLSEVLDRVITTLRPKAR
jgi:hypothetical protein